MPHSRQLDSSFTRRQLTPDSRYLIFQVLQVLHLPGCPPTATPEYSEHTLSQFPKSKSDVISKFSSHPRSDIVTQSNLQATLLQGVSHSDAGFLHSSVGVHSRRPPAPALHDDAPRHPTPHGLAGRSNPHSFPSFPVIQAF